MLNRWVPFLLLFGVPAFGWGEFGHRVIARIAASHIKSPEAARRILGILDGEAGATCTQPELAGRLACISSWADEARRNGMSHTRNWHFVNIPRAASRYDGDRDCRPTPNGDCIVRAVERFEQMLRNGQPEITPLAKAEALKFLVHFIGDLHQPLHAVDDSDQGGNLKIVTWLGEANTPFGHWNLHGVWDSGLLEKSSLMHKAAGADDRAAALAQLLIGEGPVDPAGTLVEWVEESHRIAVEQAYGTLPAARQGTDRAYYALGQDYCDRNSGVVEMQLRRAGYRLARVLNGLFE